MYTYTPVATVVTKSGALYFATSITNGSNRVGITGPRGLFAGMPIIASHTSGTDLGKAITIGIPRSAAPAVDQRKMLQLFRPRGFVRNLKIRLKIAFVTPGSGWANEVEF